MKHPEVKHFISIEDDWSPKYYNKFGIAQHLLQTRYFVYSDERGGLCEEHIQKALKIWKLENPFSQ